MITLFIIAIGNPEYKKYSLEILKDFFKKYENVEIFILEDEGSFNIKKAHPSWLKLISHKYTNNNNLTLCWDLDLLPRNKNIEFDFSLLDDSHISMCYDTSVILKFPKFNSNFYLNGGLISIPVNKRGCMESIYFDKAPGTYPSYEQYYLNDYFAENNEIVSILPPKYNTLYHNGFLFDQSDFLHYTWQCDDSLQRNFLIKQHHERYFST